MHFTGVALQSLALDRLGDAQIELDDEDLTPRQRRVLQRLATALNDDDDGCPQGHPVAAQFHRV